MKNGLTVNKFSFVQMFNDSRGKTSASLFCGILIIIVSCIGFITSIILNFGEGVMGAGAFVVSGTGLILGKTYSKQVAIKETQYEELDKPMD